MEVGKKNEAWVTFAGIIDQQIVRNTFGLFNQLIGERVEAIHILVHSTGGAIADGVALYYYLRSLPVEIVAYNCGSVSSAATTAFLGAQERVVSPHATFMVHKTIVPVPNHATGPRLHAAASSVALDDIRTEAILREHVTLSSDQWEVHRLADLTLSAEESVKCGLAHRIGLFLPAGPMYFI